MGRSEREVSGVGRVVGRADAFAEDQDDGIGEPVGIGIAGPRVVEPTPRVLAYVWGPVPEAIWDEVAAPLAA